ncbi:MAG: hypothetical protein ACK4PR_01555 [Gammaproteobacteria bacterium]
MKNDNYPSAISNATRITTACHDYTQAAPATFGVIHQDVDRRSARVQSWGRRALTLCLYVEIIA